MDAKTSPSPHGLHSDARSGPSNVPGPGPTQDHAAHEVAGRRWTGAGSVPVPAGHALPTSGFLFWRPARSLCCAGELLWESVEAVPRCTPKVLHYRLSCLCG